MIATPMRLLVGCSLCIREVLDRGGAPEELRVIFERPALAVITTGQRSTATCPAGHTFAIQINDPGWAVLYERALQRLAAGERRDAVLDAYTALDMYLPTVPVRARSRDGVRENPGQVLDKLFALEQGANEMLDKDFGGTREDVIKRKDNVLAQCSLALLSDTVVLALATKSPDETSVPEQAYRTWSVVVASRFASWIMRMAAREFPPLAYRGCITHGRFAIERTFIIGEAVDRAADLMGRAQGAFVWCAPEAKARLDGDNQPAGNYYPLVRYKVPLKGGDIYSTYVVSPFDIPRSPATAPKPTVDNRPPNGGQSRAPG